MYTFNESRSNGFKYQVLYIDTRDESNKLYSNVYDFNNEYILPEEESKKYRLVSFFDQEKSFLSSDLLFISGREKNLRPDQMVMYKVFNNVFSYICEDVMKQFHVFNQTSKKSCFDPYTNSLITLKVCDQYGIISPFLVEVQMHTKIILKPEMFAPISSKDVYFAFIYINILGDRKSGLELCDEMLSKTSSRYLRDFISTQRFKIEKFLVFS